MFVKCEFRLSPGRILARHIGLVAVIASLLAGGAAHAANFQVPAGVSGTLVFSNSNGGDLGLVPTEFGLVQRDASGNPQFIKLTMNLNDSDSDGPFYRVPVSGGERFEMYIRRNAAGEDPVLVPQIFSSDPTRNNGVDSTHPEHLSTNNFATNQWSLAFDQVNHTTDSIDYWESNYGDFFAYFRLKIEPACNNTTIPCPDPNVITSNHGPAVPTAGRGVFNAVQTVVSKLGPSIGASRDIRPKGSLTCVNARINNATWNFVQESVDFTTQLHEGGGGCGPDEGSSFSGPHFLKQMEIRRFHRPKYDFMPISSFGIGVFSEFDMNLTIYPGGSGQEANVVLFDPKSDAPPINFYDVSPPDNDSTVDGIYHDRTTRAYRSLTFQNAAGVRQSNPRLATAARLVKLNGESFLFEIVNLPGGTTPPYLSGRLKEFKDRNNNLFTVAYSFLPTATTEEMDFDREYLFEMNSVTDMMGARVSFSYNIGDTGRHIIEFVTWIDTVGRSIRYTYSGPGSDPDRLTMVTYPDNEFSIFSRFFDTPTQTWGMTFDDVAVDGNGKNHVFAYVSNSYYVTPDNVVHNQPAGLVRRVVNGDGERVYQNWEDPNNANTTYFVEGTGGPGSRMTRLKTNAMGAILEVARGQGVGPDPLLVTFVVEESYVPNALGLIGSITNAVSQVTTLARDAVGVATGVTTPDGKTTTTTVNASGHVTHQVDALGVVTDMTYDTADNLLTSATAVGTPRAATWRYTYNSRGLMTSVTNPLNVVTDYGYDASGRLTSLTDPADVSGGTRAVRRFEYDTLGRRTAEVDQAARRTTFSYDVRGRLVTTTFPDATTETTSFGVGFLAGVADHTTDRNGVTKQFTYDSTRRLILQTSSNNQAASRLRNNLEYYPGRYIVSAEVNDGTRIEHVTDVRDRQVQKIVYTTQTKSLLYQTIYDAADRVTTELDPYNRRTFFVYDANGRMTRKLWEMVPNAVAAGANIATLTRITTANPKYVIEDDAYDAAGRQTQHTDGRGIRTTYAYDELGRRTQMVEAVGTTVARTTTFQYDLGNNLTTETGPRATTVFTYTRRSLVASKVEASGRPEAVTFRRTYTLTGAVATSTDPKGGVTTYTYATNADRVVSVKDAANFTTSMTYDALGQILTRTDPNGLVMKQAYDGRNRKTKQTDGLNQDTLYTYDDDLTDNVGLDAVASYRTAILAIGFGAKARGHAMQITNPAGEKRLVVTDGLGRKALEIDALGNVTKTGYDTVTNNLLETKVTSPLGTVTTIRQDTAVHTREAVDPDSKLRTTTFDADGNMLSARDANSIGIDCVYNELNQQTSCTNTLAEKTTWVRDLAGNITSVTDPIGNATTCAYDALNRKTSCTDRLAGVRSYTYDANSNLLTSKDAQNGTTTYTYDARNLQLTAAFPDSTGSTDRVTMTYDAGGRVSTSKDQSGNTLTMTYDALNRLTKTTYPDSLNDSYFYDSASRLTSTSSARYGVLTSRGYDAAGRVIRETSNLGGTSYEVTYGYDAASRLASLTYPDGSQVTRTYGLNRDLVTEIKRGATSVAKYTYDNGGRVTSTTLGNTRIETPTYITNDDQISQLSTTTVGTLTYTYDKNHNKLTEGGTAASGNQTFVYDKEDKLTSWVGPSLTQTWVLSAEGDWTSTTRNMVAENRTHNAAHELTAVAGTAITYDPRGNMTRDDKANNLAWDFNNRLKQYQKSGGPTIDYLYDALGRRVGRKVGTSTVVYVFAEQQMIAEYKDGALTTDYIVSPVIDDHVAYFNGGRLFWYSKDPLKSVKAVTNDLGAVVERYRYTAFGERTILSAAGAVIAATTVNNFIGFTGRPHDVDTKLIDLRSRQFEPRLGRFISRDSVGYRDGLSLYRGYFAPNATDPSGNSFLGSIAKGISGAVGGVADGIGAVGNAIVGGATAVGNAVVDTATAVGSAVVDTAAAVGTAVVNGAVAVAGLVGDIGSAVLDAGKFLVTELWSATTSLARGAWRLGGEFVQDVWSSVKTLAVAYWDLTVTGMICAFDIVYAYGLLFTGHPLDALKKLTAGLGNLASTALNTALVYSSIIGGWVNPVGGFTTLLGVGLGVAGWIAGGGAPEIHWHNGGFVFEFPNSVNFFAANITIGRAVLYKGAPTAELRAHEWAHVTQYGLLGETWIPIHLTSQGISVIASGDNILGPSDPHSYDRYNIFEKGPYQANHQPWPRIPRIPW